MLNKESIPGRHLFNRCKKTQRELLRWEEQQSRKVVFCLKRTRWQGPLGKLQAEKPEAKKPPESRYWGCESWLHIPHHPKGDDFLIQPELC